MNRTRLLAILFLMVALVQLALPAMRIHLYEKTLHEGTAYKFRTAPVDPYDAFRGRYVALRFDTNNAQWSEKVPAENGQKVFAMVEKRPDGFAHFTTASSQRPAAGDYLEVKVTYTMGGEGVMVELPFERFYMEETVAPQAEVVYREHSAARGERDAYAVIRVRQGLGVIEQVYMGDKTLAQAARGE
jgi:hypothetical protein